MASRSTVSQQPRGEEVVAGGGKPKNMAREWNSRRVLNDIGNLVNLRAPGVKRNVQISRPVTRNNSVQLIDKSQSEAQTDNKKSENVDDGAQLVANKVLPLAEEKMTTKPKPHLEEIVISPGTEDNKESPKKSDPGLLGSARRKKLLTTTSILTARSRAACGLVANSMPKNLNADIDAADIDNELAVVEYVEDIYNFYKLTESETKLHAYMDSQPELNEKMRAILVDWLFEVHNRFQLMPETLYLAINLVDRFLCLKPVPRKELQLLGISAMLIACKYEEIWAPQVKEFVCISDNVYTSEKILKMEKIILGKLEWNITVPTTYVFLIRFIKASIPDKELENMVYFFAELALMNYTALAYSPSMVAASAVYVARCTLHKSPTWTETLKLHTQYTESQLMNCAKLIVTLHSTAADSKLQAVFKKYSKPEHCTVALSLPAKSILTLSS